MSNKDIGDEPSPIEFDSGVRIPKDLEDRIISELRTREAFKIRMSPTFRFVRMAGAFVFAFLLFFAGSWYGRTAGEIEGKKYMLLLENPPGFENASSHVKEYGDWFHQIGAQSVTGEKLSDKSWALQLAAGEIVVDHQGNVETPSGFFVIAAASDDEALKIASTCPHLKYKGSVIVRPIE